MAYRIKKIELPFEGSKWVIEGDKDSGYFGTYSTKKAALEDAKEFGLKIEK